MRRKCLAPTLLGLHPLNVFSVFHGTADGPCLQSKAQYQRNNHKQHDYSEEKNRNILTLESIMGSVPIMLIRYPSEM